MLKFINIYNEMLFKINIQGLGMMVYNSWMKRTVIGFGI